MRINIKRLEAGESEGEKRLDFGYELNLSGIELSGIKPFPEPVRLDGSFVNRSGMMTLSYKAAYTREEPCARCLASVSKAIEAEYVHNVIESEDVSDETDGFIPAPDGFLDMDELALADILLSREGMLLCDPDCKGLCPKCGVNLNEHTCSCRRTDPDPRFAKLLELLKPEGSGE